MYNAEKLQKLHRLAEENNFRELRKEIVTLEEIDISEFIEEIPIDKGTIVFRTLPKDIAAEVFTNFERETQERIVNEITDQELLFIIDEMYLDDLVDMVEESPAGVVKKVLKNTDSELRYKINEFLQYPKDSAGSIMTAEFTNLRYSMTVKEALDYIRKNGVDSETLYNCFVISKKRVLQGVVPLNKLMLADDDELVSNIMEGVVKVNTDDYKEDVANVVAKYDYISVPVVDSENRLVGIITVDDIIDVLEAEATEDFERMAGTIPSGKPYLKTSAFTLAKNRIPWLLFLMISGMITGNILSQYEAAFAAIPILVTFIPMLTDTGGNSGSQSSTLVIRGMVLSEIEIKDGFRVIWKELQVGLISGLVLSLANYVRLLITYPGQAPMVLVVTLSLFATVVLAKVVGGMLPIIAKLFKADPAIMASPLITTIVDAVSLIIYFHLAEIILKI
ncbi:MAG: magnesium transporter [Clostridium sp.]|nr:magnesium transporter [Clostridium sp.]